MSSGGAGALDCKVAISELLLMTEYVALGMIAVAGGFCLFVTS